MICSHFMLELSGKGTSGEIQYLSWTRLELTVGDLRLFIVAFNRIC